jgi:hypothetical protein
MARRYTVWVIALLAVLTYRVLPALKSNVFFPSKFPVGYIANGTFSTDCTTITDVSDEIRHCKDISFWEVVNGETGAPEKRVLLSCDPGRLAWNTIMGPLLDPEPRGGLWVVPSGRTEAKRVVFENYPEGHDFHPFGAEAYPTHSPTDSTPLFVINHAREKTVVEQFLLSTSEPYTATWVRTISHPAFVALNALALTGPDSFYVSNDHLFTRRLPFIVHFLPFFETLLCLPFGWVSHVQVLPLTATTSSPSSAVPDVEIKHTFAALGIPFANGIAISPAGDTLAVSSSSVGLIYFYTRDPSTNKLTYRTSIRPPFSPDNLSYDARGFLIAAGHPHLPSMFEVASNKTGAFSPSWVVAIRERREDEAVTAVYDVKAPVPASKVPPSKSQVAETVFQSNGLGFGSSSTGLRDGSMVYISSLFGRGILFCKTPASA